MVADLVRPIIPILAHLSHIWLPTFETHFVAYRAPVRGFEFMALPLVALGSWFSHSSLTMVHHGFAKEQWFSNAIAMAFKKRNGD